MIFFCISIILYLVQNFSNKQFGRLCARSSAGVSLVQNGVCTLSAAIVLILFGNIEILPARFMMYAFLFGGVYIFTVFLLLKAFMQGPMGASTLLCNMGMFISAFYGVIRFNDDFTLYIAAGSILMLVSIILSTPKEKAGESAGWQWFLFAMGSGLSNGVVASVKREAISMAGVSADNFLIWGFIFASIIAFFTISINKDRLSDAKKVISDKKLILCGVFAGIGTAGGNLFQMLAMDTVSSAIVYPFTAGVLVISLYLASLLIYKEIGFRLKNAIAVSLCIAAIILINIK